MHALIIGGTGRVGRSIVSSAIESDRYSQVTEFGRRFLPVESSKRKTVTYDFDHPSASEVKKAHADLVHIALGTYAAAAGTAERFKQIDQDWVVDFAAAAKNESKQRLVYCSSWGSDRNSRFLYMRSKGETEQRLSELGYAETIIFKPAYLRGERKKASDLIAPIIMGTAGLFGFSTTIPVEDVGVAMSKAGVLGIEGLQKLKLGEMKDTGGGKQAWYVSNRDVLASAKTKI